MKIPLLFSAVGIAVAATLFSTVAVAQTPVGPPYTFDFLEDELEGWTVIDANDDGFQWLASGSAVSINANVFVDMDDWLITPPIELEAGKRYEFSFDYFSVFDIPETLEVRMGTSNSVSQLTETIMEPTEFCFNEQNPGHFSHYLIPEQTGNVYIGFHGMSPQGSFLLVLRNVSISEGMNPGVPGPVGNLKVTPHPSGLAIGTVFFTTPAKTLDGETLRSLSTIEIYRDGVLIKEYDGPAPGGLPVSYDDYAPQAGEYTYTVIGKNKLGTGVAASATAYLGFTYPAPLPELNVSRTDSPAELLLSWQKVDRDFHGLAYPEGAVKYNVYGKTGNQTDFTLIGDEIEDLSFLWNASPDNSPMFVEALVRPSYKGMQSTSPTTESIAVGTPYRSLTESFSDQSFHYVWNTESIKEGTFELTSGSDYGLQPSDNDNGLAVISGYMANSGASFTSALMDLSQIPNPVLQFALYNLTGIGEETDDDLVTIAVRPRDASGFTIVNEGTINELCHSEKGWQHIRTSLAQYAAQTVQFKITLLTRSYIYKMMDAVGIISGQDHDLALSRLTAPAKVKSGTPFQLEATVANEGFRPSGSYTVEIWCNGVLHASEEATGLEPGQTSTFVFDALMSPFEDEPQSWQAGVAYGPDTQTANDLSDTCTVIPVKSSLAPPAELHLASRTEEGGIYISWSAPSVAVNTICLQPDSFTEDFEDAEAFSNEFGNWTFIDGDQSPVGGFQGLAMPGITPGETCGSFFVWDTDWSDAADPSTSRSFKAASGTKYLFSMFRWDNGPSDEYAVSPLLDGQAQTISFKARSYDPDWLEKIEVLYSTTGNEAIDFTGNVAMPPATVPSGGQERNWTQYTVNLPEETRYFAIHSIAEGAFMLMIDDVTFRAASTSKPVVTGYNLYRDREKIASADAATTSYFDKDVAEGQKYRYAVTAVYDEATETAPTPEVEITYMPTGVETIRASKATVIVSQGAITVDAPASMQTTILSIDGTIYYSGTANGSVTVPVPTGTYIIKTGNRTMKTIVP